MAKLIRKTQKVFGQDGATDQFAVFGTMKRVGDNETPDYSKDIEVIQSNAAYSQGWQDAVIANYAPFMEELNSICYSLTYQMSYLLQNGVPEWDDGTTYYINSIVVGSNSLLYRCLTDNCLNVDPTTDDGTNWYNYSLYGANQDLSNLTTAGIDKLHALKGYLDSGKLLSDPQLFEAVYGYNHSTFDLSKFTKVGSPIITDDGIASGFSTSNYLTIPVFDLSNFTFSMSFDITSLDTTTVLVEDNTIWRIPSSQIYRSRLALYTTKRLGIGLFLEDNTNNTTALQTEPLTALGRYKTIFMFNGTKYTFIVVYPDGSIVTKELSSTSKLSSNSNPIFIGTNFTSAERSFFAGNIDLKSIEVKNYDIPIFSGTKTGIDTIKPADYTVVGSPTISADGIATSLNSSNYITLPNLTVGNNWELTYKVIWNTATRSNSSILLQMKDGTVTFQILNQTSKAITSSIYGMFGSTKYINYISDSEVSQFTDGDVVLINLKANNNVLYYTVYKNGSVFKTNHIDSITNNIGTLTEFSIGQYSNASTTMQIDLNAIKVYKDGNLVFQPCLLIPYNESSTGSKVVDVAYRDRVIDVFEQYGSANYYTIDEVNQNATLPMGEIYGFMPSITYW